MNRFSARTRCARPASMRRHSLAAITRGSTSSGHARSMLPSVSV